MAIILQLALGLSVFLFGMHQLESGVKDLSARKLRLWLLQSTRTPLGSSATGVLLTALLQSSSLVGLITLAFASAGILPLVNAVGILLGANLGTTITGWLVTFLGFKLDLEHLAVPLIALGGLSQVITATALRFRATGQLILGLGLLLFGLNYMKSSVDDLPTIFSLDALQGHHALVYLLFGTVFTAIIQSSSAMMMLTLAALNSGLIAIPEAAALVIGADLGTTSTVILGSLSGQVVKRQLAFAHCFFNLVVDIAAFFILLPILPQLLQWLSLDDPLYSLVTFHSAFNLLGLAAFLPVIRQYSDWIERLFSRFTEKRSPLHGLPTSEPVAAIPVLAQYIKYLWLRAIETQMPLFDIRISHLKISNEQKESLAKTNDLSRDYRENYDAIKHIEGEILQKVLKIQQQTLVPVQTQSLTIIIETTRAIVYACKTLKDILQNLELLQMQETAQTTEQFQRQRQYHLQLYSKLLTLLLGEHGKDHLREEVERLLVENDRHQTGMDRLIYLAASQPQTEGRLISTQLNVNREIHHAAKNLLQGFRSWVDVAE